jgi:hypothetical protein
MSKAADYRKLNDRSQNSSTYHKKDGTPVRQILKRETKKLVDEENNERH